MYNRNFSHNTKFLLNFVFNEFFFSEIQDSHCNKCYFITQKRFFQRIQSKWKLEVIYDAELLEVAEE